MRVLYGSWACTCAARGSVSVSVLVPVLALAYVDRFPFLFPFAFCSRVGVGFYSGGIAFPALPSFYSPFVLLCAHYRHPRPREVPLGLLGVTVWVVGCVLALRCVLLVFFSLLFSGPITDFALYSFFFCFLVALGFALMFERRSFLLFFSFFTHIGFGRGVSACTNWALFLMRALNTFTPTGVMNWARVRALLRRT
jgi:hypothetical protein